MSSYTVARMQLESYGLNMSVDGELQKVAGRPCPNHVYTLKETTFTVQR